MTNEETTQEQRANTELRWLTPKNTRLSETEFHRLTCVVEDDETGEREEFDSVQTMLLFPVRYPRQLISLRNTGQTGLSGEIGIIQSLDEFPHEQQALIMERLDRQYYEQIIERIHRIESDFGMLFFDVDTQRGREQFVMPWRASSAVSYGERGKVLLEALGNRYIVPDIDALPPADKRRFTNIIYW
jgi:ATP-binding cassette, subfamily B, bacterial